MTAKTTAYELMFRTAKEWLSGADPEEIARLCGITWIADEQVFAIKTLGKDVRLTWPALTAEPELENWHMLVLLHYLYRGDGFPPAGTKLSPADMKDGLIRGGKFAFTAERSFSRMLRDKPEEVIASAFSAIGAERVSGKADFEYRIPFLPHFPVYVSIYLADEDFPASGKFFVDAAADHYLSIEDAVTVGDLILSILEKMMV